MEFQTEQFAGEIVQSFNISVRKIRANRHGVLKVFPAKVRVTEARYKILVELRCHDYAFDRYSLIQWDAQPPNIETIWNDKGRFCICGINPYDHEVRRYSGRICLVQRMTGIPSFSHDSIVIERSRIMAPQRSVS